MQFDGYFNNLRTIWSSSKSTLIPECLDVLNRMASDQSLKLWLAQSLTHQESKELYRDESYGFILTAYTENLGQYRPPHNHGNGWVIYSVLNGEMEMGSYDLDVQLKDLSVLRAGDSRVYFPGDIHDTRCLSHDVIIIRLTSCDLQIEVKEGRMKKYQT